jgi:adenine phosphoribosyltransferase
MEELSKIIRDVPDFPKKGIVFKDITPLLHDHKAFSKVLSTFEEQYKGKKINIIAAIESRGFIFGSALADRLKCSFVPIRKKGKLPYKTITAEYSLEYGTDFIQIHEDAIKKGDKVLLIDDLLATGGTAKAALELIRKLKGDVAGVAFVIELGFLKGRDNIKGEDIFSIIKY